jgi:hypothetical protein|tara:strand:- start:8 stop:661 length:654 start_codon:yes stop_codon:yes gene_type:complete
MFRILNFILIIFLFFFSLAYAENINVFDFTEEELSTLKVRKVRGADAKTKYTLGNNENGKYIKAEANNSASGLGKELKINLKKTPFLNITWKVEKDLTGIVENSKKGHDYAARVFVVKKTGATPLSNRAMNYVFSSNNDINTHHPSPFTKKSIDYVLSTTKEDLNEWVTVKVNVRDHFKKFHDLDLDDINGIAIMSDTDNSKLNAIAYYQNIYFSSN